ncbi:ABC transporter ATP-binding protein [Rhodococcus sp. MS13]|uniref:ABC transporter ATP-binding protein n=1 Tax=Rhodococcus sp. MS13 TaxID=2579940 RepID=UPI0015623E69|nr:ABC transporter ATP-binding protein [Rhodococcus sp. MS13]NRH30210.1 ABC transporter ATP-binding protein [Rhodococcus sp. MS13]
MLLDIDNLSLDYETPTGPTRILSEVSLHVDQGETVGLVGESGSGKSSTARAALRLLDANAHVTGTVRIEGTDITATDTKTLRAARSHQVGLIHQDPRASLNPVRRIGDSLTERLVHVHGVSRQQARSTGLELLDAVGIDRPEQRIKQFPHELSGGMLQRVVIAAALSARPRLLIADEATSALDVTTQAEVLAILRAVQEERRLGLLFITHDLHLAAAFCDRVYVMYRGRVLEERRGEDLFAGAEHDYTRTLLDAAPTLPRPKEPTR